VSLFSSRWVVPALVALFVVYACDQDDSKITKLRREVRELKKDSVRLAPGLDGYQVIRHDLGSATLSLKEVKAHPQGSVITLEIGNLTSANITGTKMTVSYASGHIEHPLEYDVQETLAAGKATRIHLVMRGVNPSDLSYIRVSNFQPKGIALIQAK
jgi:hypothetical protein